MCGLILVEDELSRPGYGLPAMARVANRPIAVHVLEAIGGAGVRRVVLVASERAAPAVGECLAEARAAAGVELQIIRRAGPLRLPCALAAAAPVIDGAACLVHRAEGLLDAPLAPLVAAVRHDADAVVLVRRDPRGGSTIRSRDACRNATDAATPPATAGVWALGPAALTETARPSQEELDVERLAARLAAVGGRVEIRPTEAWWTYGGDAHDLLALNRLALDRLTASPERVGLDAGSRVEGRVAIHPRATVERTVIVGPTVIGPGAVVRDAYLGAYTSVGEGAHIEGVEVERSIVEAGATVSHVGHRLCDSVVGPGARVHRDFTLPRSLRLSIGAGAEIGLC